MKVALYARVSSERQDVNLSISSQLKALREYAWKNGYSIVQEFVDEAESGRSANRPAFKEMISLARLKQPPFRVILVWKLSRFARSREDSIIYKSLLRKHGIQVVSVSEPLEDSPAGRLLEGIIEVIDEFYSSNLAQDVKRGMREVALRGFYGGGKPPYGYAITKVKDGEVTRSTLILDSATAPVVKRIYGEATSGKGLKEIAKSLNKDGVTTRSGRRWSTNTIRWILQNESYTGTLVWGKRGSVESVTKENVWPAIVDRGTFKKAEALIHARAPRVAHPRRVTSNYLLSGLIKCGVCGQAMGGRSAKSGKFFYYRCVNATKRGSDECPGYWLPKSKIEGFVIDKIKNYILSDDNLFELVRLTHEEIDAEAIKEKAQLELLEQQIKDVESRLNHLYDALETGTFTGRELAPRLRELQSRKEKLECAKHDIETALKVNVFELPDIHVIRGYIDDLRALLSSSGILEQRALLKSFVREIRVGVNEAIIHYSLPMPPTDSTQEAIGVLPFTQKGRPCRSRTCDTLIKSQVDFFRFLGVFSKLESTQKIFNF